LRLQPRAKVDAIWAARGDIGVKAAIPALSRKQVWDSRWKPPYQYHTCILPLFLDALLTMACVFLISGCETMLALQPTLPPEMAVYSDWAAIAMAEPGCLQICCNR
jgi:hypothetical protein